MKSYRQLYQKLPEEFIDTISEQYGPNEIDRILAGFMCTRLVTLRVNRLKTDVRHVMDIFREENIKFERVLWYEDALIIRNKKEKDLEGHRLYTDGHIYLQSLSSMIPPLVLKPRPGWRVLDLTAAPGSKSTQIASLMNNEGYIMANELNPIRAERLKFNIVRQGAKIAEVRVGDGRKLGGEYGECFDAVLLDAPCSGTGLFMMDSPRTYRGWSAKNTIHLVKEQRKLMESAIQALKPGGVFVYSTCSLLRQENDENIAWMLENFGDRILPERISLKPHGSGVEYSMINAGDSVDCMMLIFPSALFEGFFVSRFRKRK